MDSKPDPDPDPTRQRPVNSQHAPIKFPSRQELRERIDGTKTHTNAYKNTIDDVGPKGGGILAENRPIMSYDEVLAARAMALGEKPHGSAARGAAEDVEWSEPNPILMEGVCDAVEGAIRTSDSSPTKRFYGNAFSSGDAPVEGGKEDYDEVEHTEGRFERPMKRLQLSGTAHEDPFRQTVAPQHGPIRRWYQQYWIGGGIEERWHGC